MASIIGGFPQDIREALEYGYDVLFPDLGKILFCENYDTSTVYAVSFTPEELLDGAKDFIEDGSSIGAAMEDYLWNWYAEYGHDGDFITDEADLAPFIGSNGYVVDSTVLENYAGV